MISFLLLYQFVFLYCMILFTGLIVYGSDTKSITGQLYIGTIIVILAAIFVFKRWSKVSVSPWISRVLLLIGGASALVLYRDLHFSFWDEHSLKQSILMSVLGLVSFVAAMLGAQQIRSQAVSSRYYPAIAMLVISTAWLASMHYPMAPIFLIALIMFLGLFDVVKFKINLQPAINKLRKLEFYLVFIAIMDMSLVIWDYQVNSFWGLYIFASLACASLMLMVKLRGPKIELLYVILLINFSLAAIYADYLLNPLHSIVSGLLLGVILSSLYYRTDDEIAPEIFITSATAAIWALVLGYAFYANLIYANWRMVFVLPAVLLIVGRLRGAGGTVAK